MCTVLIFDTGSVETHTFKAVVDTMRLRQSWFPFVLQRENSKCKSDYWKLAELKLNICIN